ncbi:MAG: HIT family protein [Nanoarchaeota archaeon]|nr:HIT family protein [Nanoarchaeota archaeon]
MQPPPFNQEQVKEINRIAALPAEEQQEQLNTFLKTLNQEQINYLQQQQQPTGRECPFCLIAQKKIPSYIIYEDETSIAILDIKPANPGHLLVLPKQHVPILSALPEQESNKLLQLANQLGKALYDVIKPEGTNLFIANGTAAGQTIQHAMIHIIPRYHNDQVNMQWEGKPITEEKLENLKQQLQGKVNIQETIKNTNDDFYYELEERIP